MSPPQAPDQRRLVFRSDVVAPAAIHHVHDRGSSKATPAFETDPG
ncbi:hypothetical protein C882_1621 [Caenispirillum salinarum AK4]|uniref:Uncharacterized protein n=1 Tax=Caenispirillum salinarum AK4 TaxID=1238182 RepID=K9HR80_9PROT|nr:hypothetical protein C882_1621 [Caenispirillum salinarum AK4]